MSVSGHIFVGVIKYFNVVTLAYISDGTLTQVCS